jgi:acyl-CoA synthetase (AMP-forming)/AMP-acid ligase II
MTAGDLRTVWDILDPVIDRHADDVALVCGPERLRFGELRQQSDRLVAGLRRSGARRGSTVAVSMHNSAEIVTAFLATMRMGARWLGLNRALPPAEQLRLIAHARTRVFLTDRTPDGWEAGLPSGTTLSTVGALGEGEAPRRARRSSSGAAPPLDPLAPAAIAYTSGTSGASKGVVHHQHAIALPGRYLCGTEDFDDTSVVGVCLPLTILNILVVAVLPAFFAGRPVVILPRPDAAIVARGVAQEGITNMSIPPPILYDLSLRPEIDPAALDTLRCPRTGGAELPDHIRAAYVARFGRDPAGTYGLTEAPSVVAVEPRGVAHVTGASGQIIPYLRVRILDPEGRDLAPEQVGEICLAPRDDGPWAGSYRLMVGYWRRPGASREALSGGVLHTGDMGCVDACGNLYVRDRKRNLILRGGTSVYPADIERVIRELPGVSDVVVVGVPDVRLGERVGAMVECPEPGQLSAEAVIAHCGERLARSQVPEYVEFAPSLPRNAMNKVIRPEILRAMSGAPRVRGGGRAG